MRAALIATSTLVAMMLLVSCGADGEGAHPSDADRHASPSASASPEDGLAGLELNDGRKWQMDEHTRSIFAQMAESFLSSDHGSLEGEGLKQAGSSLQADVDALIQGCTMTGDAHNQLHVYLTGYMPAVAALSESGRVEDADKVRHYLEGYGAYFE